MMMVVVMMVVMVMMVAIMVMVAMRRGVPDRCDRQGGPDDEGHKEQECFLHAVSPSTVLA
jgi:heme/copper-type cytochrome/quinol oxidase subunit 2